MRTDRMLLIAVSAFLLTSSAHSKRLPLDTPAPQQGTIGITVKVDAPIGLPMPVSDIYFARVIDSGEAFIVSSNYSKKDQIYMLNANPGRYVAVAAKSKGTRQAAATEYDIYFPKDMIAATEVTVLPGRMVFMGEFSLKSSGNVKELDQLQTKYFHMISPDSARKGAFGRMFANKVPYRGELLESARGREAELKFWERARDKVFKDEQAWVAAIDGHLRTLATDEARAPATTK